MVNGYIALAMGVAMLSWLAWLVVATARRRGITSPKEFIGRLNKVDVGLIVVVLIAATAMIRMGSLLIAPSS